LISRPPLSLPRERGGQTGFIEAEGCFSVYKLYKDKDYLVASFDVAQRDGEILISAIREYLSFS
jgi:hypothetical protein